MRGALLMPCMMALSSFALIAPASARQASVTYVRDIAPLLRDHCTPCHRAGGDAPFSLSGFDAARRRAALMATVTRTTYMPPWKPNPGPIEFHGRRRLTTAEIWIFQEWVRQGAVRGDGDEVVGPDDTTTWPAGEPDVVVRLPAFRLSPGGFDVFRNFVVSVPAGGARIVRGLHFKARNPAVHHANIRVDATTASRQLDAADPDPGYEGIIARSADFPDGQFLGWTPGQGAPALDDALAWTLPPGADLVVQLHLRPTGADEVIEPEIGVYFGTRLPARAPVMMRLSRQDLRIPASAITHAVESSFVLPVDGELRAIQPHAHTRARAVLVTVAVPRQPLRTLLAIGNWDFRWQDRYVLRTPERLPAGARISMHYQFGNPDPHIAEWGWRTSDEMADVWLQFTTTTDADRLALAEAARVAMQRDDVIGSELLVTRQPEHVPLRNDLGMLYMSLKDPVGALRHFSAVTRLEPASASAHFNEGVAREASGDLDGALSAYRRAIERQPNYAAAHNNVGAIQMRRGQIAHAAASFGMAVTLDRANADAVINLATARLATGDPDGSLAHLTTFVSLRPDRWPDVAPLVWRLAAHRDKAMRRPAQARQWAERLVQLSSRAPAFLDLLAAAQAADGDFDAAVRTMSEAIAQLPAHERPALDERLARYRARQAFVLP